MSLFRIKLSQSFFDNITKGRVDFLKDVLLYDLLPGILIGAGLLALLFAAHSLDHKNRNADDDAQTDNKAQVAANPHITGLDLVVAVLTAVTSTLTLHLIRQCRHANVASREALKEIKETLEDTDDPIGVGELLVCSGLREARTQLADLGRIRAEWKSDESRNALAQMLLKRVEQVKLSIDSYVATYTDAPYFRTDFLGQQKTLLSAAKVVERLVVFPLPELLDNISNDTLRDNFARFIEEHRYLQRSAKANGRKFEFRYWPVALATLEHNLRNILGKHVGTEMMLDYGVLTLSTRKAIAFGQAFGDANQLVVNGHGGLVSGHLAELYHDAFAQLCLKFQHEMQPLSQLELYLEVSRFRSSLTNLIDPPADWDNVLSRLKDAKSYRSFAATKVEMEKSVSIRDDGLLSAYGNPTIPEPTLCLSLQPIIPSFASTKTRSSACCLASIA